MMEVCVPFRCEKLYLLQPKLIKKYMLNRVNIYPGIFNSDWLKLIE